MALDYQGSNCQFCVTANLIDSLSTTAVCCFNTKSASALHDERLPTVDKWNVVQTEIPQHSNFCDVYLSWTKIGNW